MGNRGRRKITAHILLAEDSVVNQEVALATLEFFGCTVEIVEDGKRAVECWQAGEYDLILMDCLMPEMDGFEATRMIRHLEKHAGRVPIIAISACNNDEIRAKQERAGMDDWLGKPFTTQELYDLLNRWLVKKTSL